MKHNNLLELVYCNTTGEFDAFALFNTEYNGMPLAMYILVIVDVDGSVEFKLQYVSQKLQPYRMELTNYESNQVQVEWVKVTNKESMEAFFKYITFYVVHE